MHLLLKVASTWDGFFTNYLGDKNKGVNEILPQVFKVLSIVLWVILGIVGAFGAIYAIYLGVQLARADEQGRRDDAKKHLITVCIAVGVTIALILIFNTFLPMLLDAFLPENALEIKDPEDPPAESFLNPLLMMLRA